MAPVYSKPTATKFDDLEEDVVRVIVSLLTLNERFAYERLNGMFGLLCNNLWMEQKIIPKNYRGPSYLLKLMRCPNIKEFMPEKYGCPGFTSHRATFMCGRKIWTTQRFMEYLALNHVKIQKFEGISLPLLTRYVKILGDKNMVSHLEIDCGYKFQFNRWKHEDLLQNLKQLKTIELIRYDHHTAQEIKMVAIRLISLCQEVQINCDNYDRMNAVLEPGGKLIQISIRDRIPQSIDWNLVNHPNLQEFRSNLLLNESTLLILNRLLCLKKVLLVYTTISGPDPDLPRIKSLFQSFLASHKLERIQFQCHNHASDSEMACSLLSDIMTLRSDLKELDMYFLDSPNLDWNQLFNMRKLKDLELRTIGNLPEDIHLVFDSLPKLQRFHLNVRNSGLISQLTEQSEIYLNNHPERRIETCFY